MSIALAVRENSVETLPTLRPEARPVLEAVERDRVDRYAASPLTDDQTKFIQQRVKQVSANSIQRQVLLGLVLAQYESVSDGTLTEALNVTVKVLTRYVHGEDPIPQRLESRLRSLSNIARYLHRTLKPEATERWLNTNIPALGGQTPLRCIRDRKWETVEALAQSYLETSFA